MPLQQDGGDGDDPAAQFEAYCQAVESTAAWGGHVELRALSTALQRRLVVLSVGMPEVVLGDTYDGANKGVLAQINSSSSTAFVCMENV